jgi:hypothetical protein
VVSQSENGVIDILNGTGSDRIRMYGHRFGGVIQLYYVGKIQIRIIETREKVYRYRSRHDDILRYEANDTMIWMIVLIHWETR